MALILYIVVTPETRIALSGAHLRSSVLKDGSRTFAAIRAIFRDDGCGNEAIE